MTNGEVCEVIKKYNFTERASNIGKKYLGDKLSELGYGQNSGGYLIGCEDKVMLVCQEKHFLNFYLKKSEDLPTYHRLHCPQLMLWVAEIAGLRNEYLMSAFNYIIAFEEREGIKNTSKGGSYLNDYNGVISEFRSILRISKINNIICNSQSWEEVLLNVKEL